MSFSWYSGQGPNFAPAYQVSGIPFVTSSAGRIAADAQPTHIVFPNVTKSIMIKNTGNYSLRVAFTKSGSYAPGETIPGGGTTPADNPANYFIIPPCDTGAGVADAPPSVFDVRCKEIFLRSNSATQQAPFSMYAALTGIEEFPVLTGSNGFKGVG